MSVAPDFSRRRHAPMGVGPALGSVGVHVVAAALAFGVAVSEPDIPEFVSYQIDLVAMPAGPQGDLVVEAPPAPAETPGPPVPDPTPVRRPDPTPPREAPREAPKEPVPAPARPAAPASGAAPTTAAPPTASGGGTTPGAAESGETMNIRMEGLRRDYPSYYNNIILQVRRCFRWQGQGTPETEIYFVIERDGTVSDQRFIRRSGNPSFDFDALGAVECAGQAARFGPLPEDLPFDRFPIRFTFRPGNVSGIFR